MNPNGDQLGCSGTVIKQFIYFVNFYIISVEIEMILIRKPIILAFNF